MSVAIDPLLLEMLPGISLDAVNGEIEKRRVARELAEVQKYAEEIRGRCKSLKQFVKEAWAILLPRTPFLPNWHIDLICDHLEAITLGKFLAAGLDNRILANVPPGTAKSLIVNVFWPSWEWGPMGLAHLGYIATSFREDACFRDGRRMRTLILSSWFQTLWPLKLIRTAESDFENEHGGRRQAVPFGSLTSERADRLLIDDPHSVDTVESEADLARATLRFRESAQSRVNDPVRSAIIVIMQRLGEKDLSGVILALKMPYVQIMLPMRFEVERKCVTPFGSDPRTKEGELLFPGRWPAATLDALEAAMTAHAVAGQHQQRPGPRGGLMFKRHWFKLVKAAPGDCRWVRGWDLAGSTKRTSAYTAAVKVGYCDRERHFYIAHVARDRVTNPETMIKNTAELDGHHVEISIPQDPGAAGLIQSRSIIAALMGFNITASPESGEKADRAIPVKSQAEAGNVSIVEGEWNETFLDEVVVFPSGAYKDQVDAMTRAFSKFILSPTALTVGPIVVTTPLVIHGSMIE